MSPGNPTVAVLTVVVGGLICFFGYRLLRITLGIVGFAVGALLAGAVAAALGAGPVVLWVAALVGGITGAILAALLYKIGLFLLGAGAGALCAALVTTGAIGKPAPLWLFVGGIAGGIITLFLQRVLVSGLTALIGAYGVVLGIAHLLPRSGAHPLTIVISSPQLVALWLGLGVVGTLVQLATGKKKE